MNLDYTPDELAFRDEVRAFVRGNLPLEISRKVIEHKRLGKDDFVTWQKPCSATSSRRSAPRPAPRPSSPSACTWWAR